MNIWINIVLMLPLLSMKAFAGYLVYQHPLDMPHDVLGPITPGYFDHRPGGYHFGSKQRLGKKERIIHLSRQGKTLTVKANGGYVVKIEYLTLGSAKNAFDLLSNWNAENSIDVSNCERSVEQANYANSGSCETGSDDRCYTLHYDQCGLFDYVKINHSRDYQNESEYPTVNFLKTGSTFHEYVIQGGLL
jgi:hypothetical protein